MLGNRAHPVEERLLNSLEAMCIRKEVWPLKPPLSGDPVSSVTRSYAGQQNGRMGENLKALFDLALAETYD